jgi:DNA repair protein RadC
LSWTVKKEAFTIRSLEDAYNYLRMKIGYEKQEVFYVLYFNTKNEMIYEREVFKGSLNTSIVHPREAFRPAFQQATASIICAHNHLSDAPDPSKEDIDVTRRLAECGRVIGIDLLDQVIICPNSMFP